MGSWGDGIGFAAVGTVLSFIGVILRTLEIVLRSRGMLLHSTGIVLRSIEGGQDTEGLHATLQALRLVYR